LHCGKPRLFYLCEKQYGNVITPIFSLKNVFTVILIDFNFLVNNAFHGMQHYLQLLQVYEILSSKCVRIATYDVRTWPFDFPQANRCCSIATDTLSPWDFDILRLKCNYLVLTFLGHVTSSVTWSFFPRMWFPIGVPLTVWHQQPRRYGFRPVPPQSPQIFLSGHANRVLRGPCCESAGQFLHGDPCRCVSTLELLRLRNMSKGVKLTTYHINIHKL